MSQNFHCDLKAETHNGEIHYCTQCRLAMCTSCMITHLCQIIHHEPTAIKVAIEACNCYKKEAALLVQSHESAKLTNEAKKKLNADKKEQLQIISKAIEDLRNLYNTFDTFYDKLIVESVTDPSDSNNEMNELVSNWDKYTNGNELLKEYHELKEKSDETPQGDKVLSAKDVESKINSTLEELGLKENLNSFLNNINSIIMKMNKGPEEFKGTPSTAYSNNSKEKSGNVSIIQQSSIPQRPPEPPKQLFFTDKVNEKVTTSRLYPQESQNSTFSSRSKEPTTVINDVYPERSSSQVFEYPYTASKIMGIKLGDAKGEAELIIYNPEKKTISSVYFTPDLFEGCYSPHFPFKNCKTQNIGNNTLIISGGFIESTISHKVFRIVSDSNNSTKIFSMPPMKYNRQGHNMIYLPKMKCLVACGGQINKSSEYIYLDLEDSFEWSELGNMNKIRANATTFCINDKYIYCVGGYNHCDEKYQKGYEMLDMDNRKSGWKDFSIGDEFAISTMGVIHIDTNKILLVGGFDGGKKYLNEGTMITIGEDGEIQENLVKKQAVSKRGLIFYSSQQFFKVGEEIINLDFRNNPVLFDSETQTLIIGNNK